MNSKFSSDERHQFKTAILAAQWINHNATGKDLEDGESMAVKNNEMTDKNPSGNQSAGTNYLLHLNAFFARADKDQRLRSSHFSLYVALFHCWNTNHFRQPFLIYRERVMRMCKIRSANTYTDCLKWLHKCGYIDYQPAGVMYAPSKVSMLPLIGKAFCHQRTGSSFNTHGSKKNDTRVAEKTDTPTGTEIDTVQGIKNNTVPISNLIHNYINKQINYETKSKQTRTQKKFFINEKKAPDMEAVINWFSEKGKTDYEARKFFYHYSAVNWTLSGQPIVDWQAVAFKWLESERTAGNFEPTKLQTNGVKDYEKPL